MIGYILQSLNYDRNKDLKPYVIPASLFVQSESFGITSTDDNADDYENLPFDLLVDESHELDFDISDHAVENGSVISDHITQRLQSVEITGLFTDHTINKSSAWVADDGRVKDADMVELVDSGNINVQMGKGIMPRSILLWKRLCALAKRRAKVRLITSLEIYEEMVIENVSTGRGPDDGESIKFKLRLREIKSVNVSVKKMSGTWQPPQPETQDSPETRAISEEAKNGKVSGKEIDPKVQAQKLENAKGGRVF